MPAIERTITVDQPLDVVWDFLTDFTTTEQWDPPTVTTQRVSGDGGVGTVYRNVSSMLGKEVEVEYTVAEIQPRSLFRLAGTTTAMDLLDTMRFEQTPAGVQITYIAEFHPRGAAKLATPLMPLGLKKIGDDAAQSMQETLARL
ncbi:SRPBCC family protein [Nocardioides sp.]|uniref:SRPBCC family protein n=1 Tax=Nocardioides sp. TaxID=35761 RepID=UPI0035197DDE